MTIHLDRFGLQRFYDPNDGGGDGGAGAGSGSGSGAGSAGSSAGAAGAGSADPANDPLDIDENRLIRIKGSDKPVKFGDHVRTFQSQWTKAAQEAARLKQALTQRDQELQRIRNAAQGNQGNGQGQSEDVLSKLKALPYLSGEQAVEVVSQIGDQIKQRDMITLALLKQVQTMKNQLGQVYGNYQTAGFDSKISRFMEQEKIPKELAQRVKELYTAYEGDDLDQEFPAILRGWYEDINKVLDANRQAAVRAARNPFLPGKGGNGSPSKPLTFKGNESPKAITDALWNSFGETET
jgi:uncharacterized protein YukE